MASPVTALRHKTFNDRNLKVSDLAKYPHVLKPKSSERTTNLSWRTAVDTWMASLMTEWTYGKSPTSCQHLASDKVHLAPEQALIRMRACSDARFARSYPGSEFYKNIYTVPLSFCLSGETPPLLPTRHIRSFRHKHKVACFFLIPLCRSILATSSSATSLEIKSHVWTRSAASASWIRSKTSRRQSEMCWPRARTVGDFPGYSLWHCRRFGDSDVSLSERSNYSKLANSSCE
jgi:hypothetical protein